MLESALRLKRAFKRMEQDTTSSYLAYFNESEEEFDEDGNVIVAKKGNKKVGPPLNKDWDNCEVFVNFLIVFYEVTLRVSASLKPVVHTTLHDIIAIEQVMANMLNVPIESASDTDLLMVEVGLAMKSKYNKYFVEAKTTQIKTLLFSMYEAYEEEVQGKNHLKRKRLDENTNDLVKRQKALYKVGSSTKLEFYEAIETESASGRETYRV
ncbi:unnamed protein product [Cuscuta campestris]|uniref:Uncharacterized protein n=1 Tax=Cuscuta campestris TaxID=132261 RepID=A0A484KW05_9ASTE|nr:unnamed protein product [Cuscuta campestris]